MGLDCVTGGFTIDTGTMCITDLFAALGTGLTDLGASPRKRGGGRWSHSIRSQPTSDRFRRN